MPTLKSAADIENERASSLEGVAHYLKTLNEKWLGFRYVIASTTLERAALSIPAIGVSDIVFPELAPELTEIPSLSSEPEYVISRLAFTEMIIKAPVTRDASLFSLADKQRKALNGEGYTSFDLVIALNGAGSITSFTPIVVYFALGCQATGFKPASANAQNNSEMPMDELRLRVTDFYRPTL